MSQIIEIPGQGEVEFPDEMSDADITSAIRKITTPAAGQAEKPRTLLQRVGHGIEKFFDPDLPAAGAGPGAYLGALGKQYLKAGSFMVPGSGVLPMAASGALMGAGTSDAQNLQGIAKDAALGGAGGALLGGVTKAAGAALGPATEWAANKIQDAAGMRALKATGTTKVGIDALTRESATRPARLGQAMLSEPGLSLRSPFTIQETAGKASAKYLEQMKGAVDAADKAGATVDLESVAKGLPYSLSDLASTVRKSMGVAKADDPLMALESLGTEGSQTQIPASQAWKIRQRLDDFMRGAKGAQDPQSTFLKQDVDAARQALSQELGGAVERAGQGAAWAGGNQGFSYMKSAGKLAQTGINRREGNQLLGMTEMLSAIPGAVAGAAHGGSAEGAAGALAAALAAKGVKNFGNPVAARTGQAAASMLRLPWGPAAETAQVGGAVSPVISPEVRALVAALRGRPALAAAGAEENQ